MGKNLRINYNNDFAVDPVSADKLIHLEKERDQLLEYIEKLKKSELKYRQMLELLPEVIFEVDRFHNITFLNDNAYRITGYTQDNVANGLNIFQLFASEEKIRITKNLDTLYKNKKSERNIYNALSKNGKIIKIMLYSSPIVKAGQVIGIRGVGIDVSKQDQIQTELYRSQGILETILNTANVMIICLDENARILIFNDECERVTGYKRAEVIGKSWSEIFVPQESRWPDQYTFAEWLKLQPQDKYERPIIIKSGERKNLLWSNSVIFSEDGKSLMAIAIGIDITKRQKAEIALAESEEKYRKLLDDSNDAIYRIVDDKFEFVNDRFVEMLGWTREEILSPDFDMFTLAASKSKKSIRDRIQAINSGKYVPNHYEFTAVTKDGRELELSVTLSQVNYQGKQMLQGIFHDITEKKKNLEALEASEERYRAVWENSPVGICLNDSNGIYHYVNPAYCKIYGYSEAELIGKSFTEVISPPESRSKLPVNYQKSFIAGQPSGLGETEFIRKDGQRIWVQFKSDFVRKNGVPIFKVIMNIDITDKKKAENDLKNSELRFKAQFKSSPLPIYSFQYRNGKFVLIDYNDAALQISYGKIADYLECEIEAIHYNNPQIIQAIIQCYDKKTNIVKEVKYKYKTTGELRYFVANYIYAPPDLVLVHTEDITRRRKERLKGIARINLLNRLRAADTIDECLTHGCKAIYEAELFKRAALTLHNSERDITNLGYIGLDDGLVQAARMAPAPDMETTKKMVQEEHRISNSYFVPTESGLNLHQQPRYINQPNNANAGNYNRWREYDELFTPIIDDNGKIVGWLSVDTPFDGNRPTRDTVLYLEEIVDIIIKKTVSIQWLTELKRDRETLAKKNIALNDLLAFIEEEKQNYKRQISETVTQVLLPALYKSINSDGSVNQTYWDLLSCNLQELATSMGKEIPIYSRLSAREAEICQMIKQGLTSKDIADSLHVTVGTIQKHREKIRKKLGIINKDVNLTNYLKNL